jgi:hypothetical protein
MMMKVVILIVALEDTDLINHDTMLQTMILILGVIIIAQTHLSGNSNLTVVGVVVDITTVIIIIIAIAMTTNQIPGINKGPIMAEVEHIIHLIDSIGINLQHQLAITVLTVLETIEHKIIVVDRIHEISVDKHGVLITDMKIALILLDFHEENSDNVLKVATGLKLASRLPLAIPNNTPMMLPQVQQLLLPLVIAIIIMTTIVHLLPMSSVVAMIH